MKLPRLFAALAALAILVSSCAKEPVPPPSSSSSYSNNASPWTFYSLAGETWVLTGYHDTVITSIIPRQDTLVFLDSTHFTWNDVPCTYSYFFYENSYRTHLNLDNTAFGDLRSMVPDEFQAYGEINGVLFSNQYYMWFERI